ncbi:DUF3499 family protein [Kocuria sp.]|uniref:DUF3499 family protein n=1 Tax=Kocuria sp. TaxID=1871328 RepID=UPI0034A3F565
MSPAATGRACSKQTCNRDAVCTLTYVYADSTAVIGPLSARREPHAYDLCPVHADTLTAPRGWRVVRLESAADWEGSGDAPGAAHPAGDPTAGDAAESLHGTPSGTAHGVRVLRDVSYRGPRDSDRAPGTDRPAATPDRTVPAPSRHVPSRDTAPRGDAAPVADAPSEQDTPRAVERVTGSEYPGPTRSIANANTQSEPLPRSVPLPDELRTPHWRRP